MSESGSVARSRHKALGHRDYFGSCGEPECVNWRAAANRQPSEAADRRERFWAKVNKSDGCWEWTGSRLPDGYGQFWVDGRNVRAHRWAFEDANGPIAPGEHVLHHCDNPPCVNPAHLFTGSIADNNADMWAKGRAAGVVAKHAQQTHCDHGHPLSGDNLLVTAGRRRCRACSRDRSRRYRARQRQAAAR